MTILSSQRSRSFWGVAAPYKSSNESTPALPDPADPYFYAVSLLLKGNGTNGSTSITDSSSNNTSITVSGSTQISTGTRKFGTGSINFGSSNGNYLSFNLLTLSGNFTLEGWLYPTAASTSGYSILFGTNIQNVQIFNYYNDGRISYYNGTSVFTSNAGAISLNVWSHFAIVRNGTSVKIYINAVDTGMNIVDSAILYISNVSGYAGGSAGYNVHGFMDDIRITNGVARYTSAGFTLPGDMSTTAAATLLIPDAHLWYKNSSIAGLSNGASISTWVNSGIYGAPYNLTSGSGLGAAVPTKQVDSGNAAAYFDGNKFLRFSNQSNITIFPTNQFKQWTIFVVYRDGNGSGNFGFLGRYGADGTNGSIGMWPNGQGNFNQIHTNDGFPVNFAMGADESKIQRGLRWGTPTSNDGTITYWDGLSGTSSTSWSVYSSDLQVGGVGTARTSYNNGYLYELILYERSLSNTEIAVVRSYLNSTFSLGATAPGSVEYTSAGTFSWTAPLTGTVRVFVVGGGAGGREGQSGGGGGGGAAVGTVSVSSGTVYTITVGAGGTFQNNGGTTSALGLTATGGVSQAGATGGAGGSGSGGNEGNYTGGRGGDSSGANGGTGGGSGGFGGTSISGNGGGGGAAGTGSVSGRTVPSGGGGGSSYGMGGGAGGAGVNGGTAGENGPTNGVNIPPGGGAYGGGSGSGNWGGGPGGGRGYVRIDWPA